MSNSKNFFEKDKINVPFFRPQITKEDRDNIQKSLSSHVLTNGPIIENFEKKFSKFTQSKYAIGVSSATAALHLSLISLGITKGDEVIVPNITFPATANVVLMTGATPILVDVDYDDVNILPDSIEESITEKTKAIIPVHFAGKSCKIKKIVSIAKKSKLKIVEDCAHAIGTKIQNRHVGNFGDAGCFSFYPTKNITSLEGGMVVTNNKRILEQIRILRNHGINRTLKERYSSSHPWDYDIQILGYNYRLDEIRSTLGLSQLKRIDKINAGRQEAFSYYYQKLKNVNGVVLPTLDDLKNNSCHLFCIKIEPKKFGKNRDFVFKKLLEFGISTSIHYKPLNLFSIYKKSAKSFSCLKNSSIIYKQILSLPLYSGITNDEQDRVVNALKLIKN